MLAASASPGWSWNLLADVQDMFSYPFMVNAFRASTVIAVTASLIGWFMVLRKQSFAGHTVAVAAFPGASAAALLGLSPFVGYFGFCIGAAVVIAAATQAGHGRGFSEDSAVVGTVQAFVLACGYLFVGLTTSLLSGLNADLFGFAFGVTSDQVTVLAVVDVAVVAILAVLGRPLLFASVDPEVARSRGLSDRAVGIAFLALLGVAVAEATQITGALLVFALLVMPPAIAQRITARPLLSLLLSVTLGLAFSWAGLTLAYYRSYTSGFCITSFAFGTFLAVEMFLRVSRRRSPVLARTAGAPA